jgi:hypothetical protein
VRVHTLAATLLALTAGLLVPAAALASSSKGKAIRVVVPTPSEGDVTIEAITTTIPSHVAKFPELQLLAPNDLSLPPSVIALTATRTHRTRRSTTFRTIVLVLDRRTAATAARIAADEPLDARAAADEPLDAGAAADEPLGARAAADEPLAAFGRLLLDGEEPRKGTPMGYVGASLVFTTIVPATSDLWSQQQGSPLGVHVDVGVQPNANAGDTDVRACWALSDTIQLGSAGKPAPGLTYGSFTGPGALPWSRDGIGSTFVHFAADCRPGADGLNTAFTPVINDLGLSPGTLGPSLTLPPPPLPLAPLGPKEALAIFLGAELAGDSDLAEDAEDDFVMWLEQQGADPSDSLMARAPVARAAATTNSTAVPANGQVTKVEVRGRFAGDCPGKQAPSVCEDDIHVQDLRPLSGGGLEVVETSQPFTIEGKEERTYTVEPTNFFVQKGDYIGLATGGGKFEVLTSAPGVQTNVFVGNKEDDNGDKLGAAKTRAKPGEELNMRVTLQPSE